MNPSPVQIKVNELRILQAALGRKYPIFQQSSSISKGSCIDFPPMSALPQLRQQKTIPNCSSISPSALASSCRGDCCLDQMQFLHLFSDTVLLDQFIMGQQYRWSLSDPTRKSYSELHYCSMQSTDRLSFLWDIKNPLL